jgi:hypothetical protein
MKKREANSERNSGDQRRLANLKGHEFKPGVSGNPAGRPPIRGLLVHLKKKLVEFAEGGKGEFTLEELIVCQLVQMAAKGDLAAIREIFDRMEGKPRQALDFNDVTKQLQGRTEEELLHYATTGRWPGESEQ